MNKTITQRIREAAEAHPIECPEWQKLQDLMVDAEQMDGAAIKSLNLEERAHQFSANNSRWRLVH